MRFSSIVFGLAMLSLVVLTGFKLDALESKSGTAYQPGRVWEQPAIIAPRYQDPISGLAWRFDFDDPESLLLYFRFTAGNAILNEEATIILMNHLYDWRMRPENGHIDLARVDLLISKFFPSARCHQSFSDLWKRFVKFKDAEKQRIAALHPEGLNAFGNLPAEELFSLQADFFSEHEIAGLFDRQNRLSQYLTVRTEIMNSKGLSDVERQNKLAALNFSNRADPDMVVKNGPCQ